MNLIKKPINNFMKLETSGSIVLFVATVLALVLANSPLSESFLGFWDKYVTISLPGLELSKPIIKWINDGFMVVFFFVIGLEIKREFIVGELNNYKKASLPVIAAIGGMIIPAVIFTVLNYGKPGSNGWGIPVATDIAFTLGILQLLGKRVPVGLKVFLMAFAIIDDLGAILIIALFYSSNLVWGYIGIALLLFGLLNLIYLMGYYNKYFFLTVGVIVWLLFLKSGIHVTIAGVLMAFTIPISRKNNSESFYSEVKKALNRFNEDVAKNRGTKNILTQKQLEAIEDIEDIVEKTTPPLQYHEHSLHGWVTYLIMPLFALANAGVVFSFSGESNLSLASNIALSMIFGKALGIFLFSYLAIRFKFSELPGNVNYKMLFGIAILGGLGFTMSLFINSLAFTDQLLIDSAKMGVLIGSLVTGVLGYFVLNSALKRAEKNKALV